MMLLRTWLLPALLAAGQIALWFTPLSGKLPDRPTQAVAVVATVLAAVALGWRRRAPVSVFAAVTVVLTVAAPVTPEEALMLITVAELVALYSVAVHRPATIAVGAAGVLVVRDGVLVGVRHGVDSGFLGQFFVGVAGYGLLVALGGIRRRWRRARRETADRLARAAQDRRDAALTERRRLARELHDVTAHHLTAIVVTATAAQRVSGRPELLAEALEFAADKGQETVTALHRLAAVMRGTDEESGRTLGERLAELAEGFRRLDQPVEVTVDAVDPVPPAVADAAYGVAREALTNTVRHATGAAVRVRVAQRAGALELTVEDDGRSPDGPVAKLGSGRGLPGMRERATALGGRLDAGPRPGGGWRVHTVLPLGTPTVVATRRWHQPLLDVGLVFTAVALPLSAVAEAAAEKDPEAAAVTRPTVLVLVTLLLLASALPLLLRRRAPWLVLAATVAVVPLWPAAVRLDLLPLAGSVLGFGIVAQWFALYTVAERADRLWPTLLAVPVVAGATAAAGVVTLALDGSLGGEPAGAPIIAGMTLVVAVFVGVPTLGVWASGVIVRRRRERILAREHEKLSAEAAQAVYAVRAERVRLAAGLRDSVLDHAERLTAVARVGADCLADGDPVAAREGLVTAAGQARAGLAAMRDLLNALPADEVAAERAPQPNIAEIPRLCADHRKTGRAVHLDAVPTPDDLPTHVDVCAYRVVEAALTAGDTEPVRVMIRYGHEDLRITVTGVPSATNGPTSAALRTRVAALGGQLDLFPAGGLMVSLPREVTRSPSV